MKLSTRNQLAGKVKDVKLGTIMSEITVDIGGQVIVAAITRGSTEELELVGALMRFWYVHGDLREGRSR